jgi:hypothetical protein
LKIKIQWLSLLLIRGFSIKIYGQNLALFVYPKSPKIEEEIRPKMTIKFLLIIQFICLSITNFPNNICHCSIVSMTKTRGGVLAIGDRMISYHDPDLEDVLNNAINGGRNHLI